MATVVVGTQWGDEGKGKFVDVLAEEMDYVVRYQGGHNAGHTVVVGEERFTLQLVPSGVLYPHVTPVIGNGVVVDPLVLVEEVATLHRQGVGCERLKVSGNAHLIFPYHREIDMAAERRLGERRLDTTKRGIGPAYADKASRVGLRVQDLTDEEGFRTKVEMVTEEKNAVLSAVYQSSQLEVSETVDAYLEAYRRVVSPLVADTTNILHRALEGGKRVLFEGAQATFLDLDHGTYPFVTSSNCTAGGACTGSGVGPRYMERIIGVVKAYTTRVGAGPFPTELLDATGDYLVEAGHEYGTNTKRRRRTGWLDAVMVRHAARVNTLTELIITKLDVLDNLEEIKVCVAYKIDGREVQELPCFHSDFERAIPVYRTFVGWRTSISEITRRDRLPARCVAYLEALEREIGIPIGLVGNGPSRHQYLKWH